MTGRFGHYDNRGYGNDVVYFLDLIDQFELLGCCFALLVLNSVLINQKAFLRANRTQTFVVETRDLRWMKLYFGHMY